MSVVMTPSRKDELLKLLTSRRVELVIKQGVKLQNLRGSSVSEPGDSTDEAELASERDMSVDEVNRLAREITMIDEALARVDRGEYGYCSELGCGDEIAAKRLEALPFAARCRDCEEAREAAETASSKVHRGRGFGVRAVTLSVD